MNHFSILLTAILLEAVIGYPQFIYQYIRHPVVWMGAVIGFLDDKYNRASLRATNLFCGEAIQKHQDWIASEVSPPRNDEISSARKKIMGIFTMLVLLTITISISLLIQSIGYWWLEVICMASLMAGRSLYDHVRAILVPLQQKNLQEARKNLAKIVGRDVDNLDESGISKAAIESLAESFSDGVVAPIFWAVIGGLPALAAYKAINTADSMIGHKTEQYINFGWAAARLDDVANFIPARISALLIAISAFSLNALKCAWRDARKHASLNSGYPEAAMSGALGVSLGGERGYDGIIHNAPIIGVEYRTEITPKDLQKAIWIYLLACGVILVGFIFFSF